MDTSIKLDERHFKMVTEKSRELGMTPRAYVQSLIDADVKTLDELLAPVRDAVKESGMTEEGLTELLEKAKHDMRAERSAQGRQGASSRSASFSIALFMPRH